MLVSTFDMLRIARKEHYAVCGFESWDSASLKAIVSAAEETRSPVIVQASERELLYAGMENYADMTLVAAKKSSVPVAVHLDHGFTYEIVARCIRHGFTSVMIDASKLPFEKNIEITRQVVRLAHATGVSVEAMLGKVGQTREGATEVVAEDLMTDPNQAALFVAETDVDSLAVSIGSVSGLQSQVASLDLKRLGEISKIVSIPLSLHGGTGVPEDQIREAIRLGIARMHIATALWQAYEKGYHKQLSSTSYVDIYSLLDAVQEEMKTLVKSKMRLFGSPGKAVIT